jgi:hypothetical protein
MTEVSTAPPASDRPTKRLQTPDVTKVQVGAIVPFVLSIAAAFGYQATDESSAALSAAIAGSGGLFSSLLVAADAVIRKARAENAAEITGGTPAKEAKASPVAPSGWQQAIPATGWWAKTGPGTSDRRPIAAWAFVPTGEGGASKLAGLVRRGEGFGLAEDVENFSGYEFDDGSRTRPE